MNVLGLYEWNTLLAASLCILSLASLSQHHTARDGNVYGIVGLTLAILSGGLNSHVTAWAIVALVTGGGLGVLCACRVKMTQLPELIALLHSFVGLAAVLLAYNNYTVAIQATGSLTRLAASEIFLSVFIGVITFIGSLVAFGKLRAYLPGRPVALRGRDAWNLMTLVLLGFVGYEFTFIEPAAYLLATSIALASGLGLHLGLSIGGADMPVVISMLNAYSGWAAAVTGFMLHNRLLIIIGALVGSSGAVLSYTMCQGMNRSFLDVLLGRAAGAGLSGPRTDETLVQTVAPAAVASYLAQAASVIITPGYGLAVAQAQQIVKQLVLDLDARQIPVSFGVHPVAGRLPGHLNVLLAEGQIPYERVFDLDEINDKFEHTDLVLVIGANDTVNPGAEENAEGPLAGMPVLKVWQAKKVVVFKRSLAAGYAGVENPLFSKSNVELLLGDARLMLEAVVLELSKRQ